MSHPVNDRYLENCQESFHSSESGFERATLLLEMRSNGFEEYADKLEDAWITEREVWLDSVGATKDDILEDEEGEFFMDIEEWGNPGDDYHVKDVKRRVPAHLNVLYWTDKKNYEREIYPHTRRID